MPEAPSALVPTDDLKPGMEAVEEVRNLNGLLLVAKGACLTEGHLRALKTWGVEVVRVGAAGAGADRPSLEAAGGASCLAEAEQLVAGRFRHVDLSLPAAQAIRQLALASVARRLAAQRASPPNP
jgi:hypothetical protein